MLMMLTYLISVTFAIENDFKNVIVAYVIDILVLLTVLTPKMKKVYFLKLGKGKN